MKQFTLTVTYDDVTRALSSDISLKGFVAELPMQEIHAVQLDTTTLFSNSVMSSADVAALNMSIARCILTANTQLTEWEQARLNKAKSDLLPPGDPSLSLPALPPLPPLL